MFFPLRRKIISDINISPCILVEDQCVDRIHRIGQSAKKIYVRKFYVENSIEERIIDLQKRKKGVARAALCDNGAAETVEPEARPSIEDLETLFRAS